MSSGGSVLVGSGGPGLLGWLGLIFVVAKLAGWVSWSWWIVLAPFWIGFAIVLLALVVTAIVAVAVKEHPSVKYRRRL